MAVETQPVSAEALAILDATMARYTDLDKFNENLARLDEKVQSGAALAVGNMCVLELGYAYSSDKNKLAAILADNPDRFSAVLVSKEVQTISQNSRIARSALIASNVYGEPTIEDSILESSSVEGSSVIIKSVISRSSIRSGTIDGVNMQGIGDIVY